MRLYGDGRLTTNQMKDMLMRQLNQDKIFGYNSYEDFESKFFKKKLIAVEDLNRIGVLKEARKQY